VGYLGGRCELDSLGWVERGGDGTDGGGVCGRLGVSRLCEVCNAGPGGVAEDRMWDMLAPWNCLGHDADIRPEVFLCSDGEWAQSAEAAGAWDDTGCWTGMRCGGGSRDW
jgi:hypothetical protein